MQEETEVVKTAQHNLITYEMPLNDSVRICLRLENLFHQFEKTVCGPSQVNTKNAMNALLKILEVTDRPDLKSKLSQTLTQFSAALHQFNRSENVDPERLKTTLKQLEELSYYLHQQHARIGDPLRQNDFLYQIRSNLTNPGGACDYRLPAYSLWQNKTMADKTKDLMVWMETFKPLHDITTAILQLTRDSTQLQNMVAEKGFYLQTLNPATPCQMIRVVLPSAFNVYPEFGAGKHRVTIHFLTPNYFGSGKPTQTQESISFQLACCKI
ncbi:MAG TPA: cell division protein ZapD [Coxiellaceae bacterium]|nr:cell division protein ZapD [Coxiellaceae bacterium]